MDNPNSSNISWKSRKKAPKVHTKDRSSKYKICHKVSSWVYFPEQVLFDSDGSSVIVDNYANDHICSYEDIFAENIEPIIYNGVATIGGKYIISKRLAQLPGTWDDDEGQLNTYKLNNIIYFPDSPFNKLSSTTMAEYTKGDEGTWVLIEIEYSIFTWDFGEYK